MTLRLDPDRGELDVEDTLTLPSTIGTVEFALNRGLRIVSSSTPLARIESDATPHPLYRAELPAGTRTLQLHYQGKPALPKGVGHGQMPLGLLDAQGVYLDGNSAWYPQTGLPIGAFALRAETSKDWRVFSVGRLLADRQPYHWVSKTPHDDLYLLAGPYTRHVQRHGEIDLSVWLQQDDAQLAQRYLGLMGEYIDHYEKLLGAYPFGKFAVVENPWQTGYGMPSFTLLGSRVLRLPFIPYTSLPHEILHNWLGNGIWVDYAKGNWSEGLTAYLADHWMKERRGQGAQHRLKSLQRYSNFAADGRDRPLLEFVSRHDDTSQAIGYDKSMMLFHMLRLALGDEAFEQALQRLWQRHRFNAIGFEQALATLLADRPQLLARFRPWLTANDAPRLQLASAQVQPEGARYRLTLDVRQQAERPLPLLLPVAVTLAAGEPAKRSLHWMTDSRTRIELAFERPPLRVDIDPGYDTLRYLDASEQPPALNQLFGNDTWLVLPSAASEDMSRAWAELARAWQGRYPRLRVALDSEDLPPDENRLLLGWDNRLLHDALPAFTHGQQKLDADGLSVADQHYPRDSHSLVLVEQPTRGQTLGLIAADSVAAVRALARKLPHYGSFGRLVFDAQQQNVRRDALSPRFPALSRQLGEQEVPLVLPAEAAIGN